MTRRRAAHRIIGQITELELKNNRKMMDCTVYRRDLHDGTRVATVFQYLPDNVSIWETKIAARCSYQICFTKFWTSLAPCCPCHPTSLRWDLEQGRAPYRVVPSTKICLYSSYRRWRESTQPSTTYIIQNRKYVADLGYSRSRFSTGKKKDVVLFWSFKKSWDKSCM
jgi:hypothetical protein